MKIAFSFVTALLLCTHTLAADITGTWNSEGDESKIAIGYDRETKTYHGTIIQITDALDEYGEPRIDKKNPDPRKRNQAIVGLRIMQGFKKATDKKYTDGTVYDPKSGHTYSGKITQPDPDSLKLRGFIGISLLGRTATWTRAK